jgi:hypothetical protein
MSVKAIDMVRKIRDRHYEETKDLPTDAQKEYIRRKAKDLLQNTRRHRRSTVDN